MRHDAHAVPTGRIKEGAVGKSPVPGNLGELRFAPSEKFIEPSDVHAEVPHPVTHPLETGHVVDAVVHVVLDHLQGIMVVQLLLGEGRGRGQTFLLCSYRIPVSLLVLLCLLLLLLLLLLLSVLVLFVLVHHPVHHVIRTPREEAIQQYVVVPVSIRIKGVRGRRLWLIARRAAAARHSWGWWWNRRRGL